MAKRLNVPNKPASNYSDSEVKQALGALINFVESHNVPVNIAGDAADVTGDIDDPNNLNGFDLGSRDQRWRDLFVAGNIWSGNNRIPVDALRRLSEETINLDISLRLRNLGNALTDPGATALASFGNALTDEIQARLIAYGGNNILNTFVTGLTSNDVANLFNYARNPSFLRLNNGLNANGAVRLLEYSQNNNVGQLITLANSLDNTRTSRLIAFSGIEEVALLDALANGLTDDIVVRLLALGDSADLVSFINGISSAIVTRLLTLGGSSDLVSLTNGLDASIVTRLLTLGGSADLVTLTNGLTSVRASRLVDYSIDQNLDELVGGLSRAIVTRLLAFGNNDNLNTFATGLTSSRTTRLLQLADTSTEADTRLDTLANGLDATGVTRLLFLSKNQEGLGLRLLAIRSTAGSFTHTIPAAANLGGEDTVNLLVMARGAGGGGGGGAGGADDGPFNGVFGSNGAIGTSGGDTEVYVNGTLRVMARGGAGGVGGDNGEYVDLVFGGGGTGVASPRQVAGNPSISNPLLAGSGGHGGGAFQTFTDEDDLTRGFPGGWGQRGEWEFTSITAMAGQSVRIETGMGGIGGMLGPGPDDGINDISGWGRVVVADTITLAFSPDASFAGGEGANGKDGEVIILYAYGS